MIPLGTLIGAFLGFLMSGPLGILFGAGIGYMFDRRRSRVRQTTELREGLYIKAIFSVLGYISKADGRVSPQEIQYAQHAMKSFELNPRQTEMAMEHFRRGKSANFDFEGVMRRVNKNLGRNTNLKLIFLTVQIEAALADGHLGVKEKEIIYRVAEIFRFGRSVADDILSRYRVGGQRQDQQTPGTAATDQDYEILGLTRDANLAEVKRAYRRKISQFHPDKLIAKGLPDEMMTYANSMSEKLNSAYKRIQKDIKHASN